MSYYSTMQYLPSDALLAPDRFDFVPELDAVSPLDGYPVARTMDQIFEMAWRIKKFRFQADITWETIVPSLTGTITVNGTVEKVLSIDADEVTQHEDEHLNPDWLTVEGVSTSDNGIDPPLAGVATMVFSHSDRLSTIKRIPNPSAPGEIQPSAAMWLPNMGLTLRDSLTSGDFPFATSSTDADETVPLGSAIIGGLNDFTIPIYLSLTVSGIIQVNDFSMVLTPLEFWTYTPPSGLPIYSDSTGARLRSPFASQR